MMANGKQPTALRAWVTFVRWQEDRTRNRLHLLVSQTNVISLHTIQLKLLYVNNGLLFFFFLLQIPTVTLDICCTGTSAISLRLRQWKTGRMLRLTVTESRLTWPASTRRKSWVSSLVSGQESILVHQIYHEIIFQEILWIFWHLNELDTLVFFLQLICQGKPGWDWTTSTLKTSLYTLMELLQ